MPSDLVEECTQTCSLCRVDALHEAYSSFEMKSEVRMRVAVLALWAKANAVGEDRFEYVDVSAYDIRILIGDEAS